MEKIHGYYIIKKDGARRMLQNDWIFRFQKPFQKLETGITDINLSRLEQIAILFDMSVIQLLTFSDSEQDQKFINEVDLINKKADRTARSEVIPILQKKVIELFEELRQTKILATLIK